MSRDFALANTCSHRCIVELTPEGRILTLPDGAQNIDLIGPGGVWMNPEGTYPAADIITPVRGPYPRGTFVEVTTSRGRATLYARDYWKSPIEGLVHWVNGHLWLKDPEYLKITRASLELGYFMWESKKTLQWPAWVHQGNTVIFAEPLRETPTIKVTYTSLANRCPRCQGTRVENDIRVGADGNLVTVADEALLQQAALKVLLTEKGSNPFHPWYGTDLKKMLGSKITSTLATQITMDVQSALRNLQKVQTEQARYQTVSARERLYTIQDVIVTPTPGKPTRYDIKVVVRNGSNQPVHLGLVYFA